jgi:hypothetical protein
VCRGPDKLRRSSTRGRVGRNQAEKDLRAHAYAGATQTYEEEVDGGEVTDPETDRNGREVANAKTDGNSGKISLFKEEKILPESQSFRDAISESVRFNEKEKVFAKSIS